MIDRDELERTVGALDASLATDATISLQDWARVESGAARVAHAFSLPPLDLSLPDVPSGRAELPDLEAGALLGQGGMGQVFAAHQRTLQREVAVKSVRADAPPNAERALVAEAMLMGHLEHPGIIPVHALGAAGDGRPALVMKRVEGVSWRALIRDPAHPHWARVGGADEGRLEAHLRILQRVCDAVHFANERGVIHRDIKPDNVMVGAWGEVWILDWGVALALPGSRVTLPEPVEPGVDARRRVVGTPAYMAPEMATGWEVDARTDVYLLGATLHEVLTGDIRHPGVNILAAVWHAAQSDPVAYDADVPSDLAALCNDATSRDPARRPRWPSASASTRTCATAARAPSSRPPTASSTTSARWRAAAPPTTGFACTRRWRRAASATRRRGDRGRTTRVRARGSARPSSRRSATSSPRGSSTGPARSRRR